MKMQIWIEVEWILMKDGEVLQRICRSDLRNVHSLGKALENDDENFNKMETSIKNLAKNK